MADLGNLAPIGHGLLGGVTTGMHLFGQHRQLALAEEEADRRREDAEALRRDRELRRTLAAVSAFNAVAEARATVRSRLLRERKAARR